jgi:CDGSH-type Zn-finger protein
MTDKRYEGQQLEGKPETRAALCRCGQSANQPYCDRSGQCRDWRYRMDGQDGGAG